MKKLFYLVLALFVMQMSSRAAAVVIEVKGSYFYPAEKTFQDIYGVGFMYGGEFSLSVWKNLEVWAGGYYFTRDGLLTFTGEETTLRIIPLSGGLQYRISSGVLS